MQREGSGLRAAAGAEWWRGAVIYQIYPRSFSDSNGDGVGDLPGITARLPYVASLGVDAVWLSPFFTSPMKDFGYDVSDYCDVDPTFGTLADFDRLLARAHELGLKVVIDQIYSHTSDRHPWFLDSRASRESGRADWYVWADARRDGSPPNNWQSVFFGPAWTWSAQRRQYYFHNFLASQPDLNVHNPAVQDALLEVCRFWLERGVDGFRLDAINFVMHDRELRDNPTRDLESGPPRRPFDYQHHIYNQSHPDIPRFLARIRRLTNAYADRFTVAEIGGLRAESEMHAYTCGNERLNTAYSFIFLRADELTPALVRRAVEAWPDTPDAGWPSWAFSNHDAPRVVTRWGRAHETSPETRAAYARLSLLLLLGLRGNVFLYQGEELGLPQAHVPFERLVDPEGIANWPHSSGRDGARTPMPWRADAAHAGFSTREPWLPIDSRHVSLSVDVQEADEGSALHFLRRLTAFRRAHAAVMRLGAMRFVEAPEPLIAFERRQDRARVLCVVNTSAKPVPWPALASLRRAGDTIATGWPAGAPPAAVPALSGLLASLDA